MGVQAHDIAFLLSAREQGVCFTRTLTLGRQELMLGTVDFARLLRKHHVVRSTREAIEFRDTCGRYVNPLLHRLGAEEVSVMDSSAYEGASLIHDLNLPIPSELSGRFDVVYDGGTLEHVFNYPVALRSAMEMVKVGGHLIIQTPANNFFGHGFYQISPELLFRVLSPEHGFELDRLFAVEDRLGGRWFRVTDPQTLRARVELISRQRVVLLAQARRCDARRPLERSPQQSDYVAAWHGNGRVGVTSPSRRPGGWLRRKLKAWSPAAALAVWWWVAVARRAARRLGAPLERKRSFRNRDFFQLVRM
jgi:hypothetical protein